MADRNSRKPHVFDRTQALDAPPKTQRLSPRARVAGHGTLVIEPPTGGVGAEAPRGPVETQIVNEGSIDHDEIRAARARSFGRSASPRHRRAPPSPSPHAKCIRSDEVGADPPPWKEPQAEVEPVVNPLLHTVDAAAARTKGSASVRS